MCGIAAIFAFRAEAPRVEREELLRIRDHMRSRGPDGEGLWLSADERVGLGHRRLSIIDLTPMGAQPMASDDGSVVITYNGEIYNYRALREELEATGRPFRGTSDTEVILRLYEEMGEAMLPRLRGMYAFAIWDGRRGAMLLARDPFGIKPLYYAHTRGTLRAASQVKALVAGGAVGRQRDLAGIAGFYLFGSVPEPFTTLSEVRCLPAGSLMWCDEQGPEPPRRHFVLARELRQAATAARELSPVERQQMVRDAVVDTVRHHMVADVPVGAFLSAGIDSCTLVSHMAAQAIKPVRTVTLAFDELRNTPADEAPLAELAARTYGTDHTTRVVTATEFERDLDAILRAMDQPSIDGINTWFVSKATRELGLSVAVSGLGGDELFGGYANTFGWIPRWRPRIARLEKVPFAKATCRALFGPRSPLVARGVSPKAAEIVALAGTIEGAYLLRRGVFMPPELPLVMDRDAAEEGLAQLRPLELLAAALDPDPGTDFARISALEASFYMRNQLLRDSDWASMAHSVELRVPLVDVGLWQNTHAMAPGQAKLALATTARPQLPTRITSRPKSGFSIPIQEWLLARPEPAGPHLVNRSRRSPHWARQLSYSICERF